MKDVPHTQLSITRFLAEGGFAVVFQAEYIGSRVALKVVPQKAESSHARFCTQAFVHECKVMASLQHRNLVSLVGVATLPAAMFTPFRGTSLAMQALRKEGGMAIVEEFVSGGSLAAKIGAQEISPYTTVFSISEALQWSKEVVEAVAHLHSRACPLLHRDIKLDNVLLEPRSSHTVGARRGRGGGKFRAVLTDFGLAACVVNGRAQVATSVALCAEGETPPLEQVQLAMADTTSGHARVSCGGGGGGGESNALSTTASYDGTPTLHGGGRTAASTPAGDACAAPHAGHESPSREPLARWERGASGGPLLPSMSAAARYSPEEATPQGHDSYAPPRRSPSASDSDSPILRASNSTAQSSVCFYVAPLPAAEPSAMHHHGDLVMESADSLARESMSPRAKMWRSSEPDDDCGQRSFQASSPAHMLTFQQEPYSPHLPHPPQAIDPVLEELAQQNHEQESSCQAREEQEEEDAFEAEDLMCPLLTGKAASCQSEGLGHMLRDVGGGNGAGADAPKPAADLVGKSSGGGAEGGARGSKSRRARRRQEAAALKALAEEEERLLVLQVPGDECQPAPNPPGWELQLEERSCEFPADSRAEGESEAGRHLFSASVRSLELCSNLSLSHRHEGDARGYGDDENECTPEIESHALGAHAIVAIGEGEEARSEEGEELLVLMEDVQGEERERLTASVRDREDSSKQGEERGGVGCEGGRATVGAERPPLPRRDRVPFWRTPPPTRDIAASNSQTLDEVWLNVGAPTVAASTPATPLLKDDEGTQRSSAASPSLHASASSRDGASSRALWRNAGGRLRNASSGLRSFSNGLLRQVSAASRSKRHGSGVSKRLAKQRTRREDAYGRNGSAWCMTAQTGSYVYMAPEVFNGKPYNAKADVFSLAVLIYQLFVRQNISSRFSQPEDGVAYARSVALSGERPTFPRRLSAVAPSLVALIEEAWQEDAVARPTAAQLLARLAAFEESEEFEIMGGQRPRLATACCFGVRA